MPLPKQNELCSAVVLAISSGMIPSVTMIKKAYHGLHNIEYYDPGKYLALGS